tara:strand:- start:191 stop:382 length:192 start_codon:yes stop_codon:yes gene_type:complete
MSYGNKKRLTVFSEPLVPRLKHTTNDDTWIEQPLFPDIEVIKRNEEGNLESRILTNEVNTETD